LLHDRVIAGRNRLAEIGQARIAITDREITKNLVVGPILLFQVNDMLDVLAQEGHDRLLGR